MSYLGIDIGTSQTKAMVFDETMRSLGTASVAYERTCRQSGWCELDPDELMRAVRAVIAQCARQCPADPVVAISFSVFGGGVTAVDRALRPVLPLISTTDGRAQAEASGWAERFGRDRTYAITGTTTHASLMLPKALWIRNHAPEYPRVHRFVTAAELAIIAIGLPPQMDWATASTTMFLDITARRWSPEILAAADLSPEMLPPVAPSGTVLGEVPAAVCGELGLARRCLVVAGGHDQQVCALGAGLFEPGSATDSLGTVECITTLLHQPLLSDTFQKNNFSNLLHVCGGKIASLAYNFSSGDLLRWYCTTFTSGKQLIEETLATLPASPSRLLVLPHFAGSGTPLLDARSQGAILGLTLQTTDREVLRAIVDAQNYEMRINLDVWRNCGIQFDSLRAYGKGSSYDPLLQIKADILDLEIHKLTVIETGCLGAAILAASGVSGKDISRELLSEAVTCRRVFHPAKDRRAQYEDQFALYRELYPVLRPIHHRMQPC